MQSTETNQGGHGCPMHEDPIVTGNVYSHEPDIIFDPQTLQLTIATKSRYFRDSIGGHPTGPTTVLGERQSYPEVNINLGPFIDPEKGLDIYSVLGLSMLVHYMPPPHFQELMNDLQLRAEVKSQPQGIKDILDSLYKQGPGNTRLYTPGIISAPVIAIAMDGAQNSAPGNMLEVIDELVRSAREANSTPADTFGCLNSLVSLIKYTKYAILRTAIKIAENETDQGARNRKLVRDLARYSSTAGRGSRHSSEDGLNEGIEEIMARLYTEVVNRSSGEIESNKVLNSLTIVFGKIYGRIIDFRSVYGGGQSITGDTKVGLQDPRTLNDLVDRFLGEIVTGIDFAKSSHLSNKQPSQLSMGIDGSLVMTSSHDNNGTDLTSSSPGTVTKITLTNGCVVTIYASATCPAFDWGEIRKEG